MPAPIVSINSVGGTKQPRRIVAGTDTPFGASFAAADDPPTTANFSTDIAPCQRMVQIDGSQTFFTFMGNFIHKSTDGGVTWSPVTGDFTSTAAPPVGIGGTTVINNTTGMMRGGPFVVYINGAPRVWAFFNTNTAQNYRIVYSDDLGVTWTYANVVTVSSASSGFPAMGAFWRGVYYVFTGSPTVNFWHAFDPVGVSISTGAVTPGRSSGSAVAGKLLCVKDRLFGCWTANAPLNYNLNLGEFGGGTWATLGIVDSGAAYLGSGSVGWGGIGFWMAPTTGNLWVAHYRSTAPAGYRLWEITSLSPFTYVEWTSSLPAALQAAPNTIRSVAWMDALLDPDGTPEVLLCTTTSPQTGSNYTTWRVTHGGSGAAPVFTNIGSSQGSYLPFPFEATQPLQGGEVTWTSGERDIIPLSRTAISGGHRYGFQLFSPNPGPDLVNVQALFAEPDDLSSNRVATIAKPPGETWTLSGGPGTWYAAGLDATSAGLFYIDIMWQSMGLGPGDRPRLRWKVYS